MQTQSNERSSRSDDERSMTTLVTDAYFASLGLLPAGITFFTFPNMT